MPAKNRLRVTPSSGNVFRDLGFSTQEAAHLVIRGSPHPIQKIATARGVAGAAREASAGQPARISDLARAPASLQHRDADRHAGPSGSAGAPRGQTDSAATSRLADLGLSQTHGTGRHSEPDGACYIRPASVGERPHLGPIARDTAARSGNRATNGGTTSRWRSRCRAGGRPARRLRRSRRAEAAPRSDG